MGQHKYNPTAIAAKKGELPPKPTKPSKHEQERWLMKKIVEKIDEETGLQSIINAMSKPYEIF